MTKKLLIISSIGFVLLQIILFSAQASWFFELFTHYAHYYAMLTGLLLLATLQKKYWTLALLFSTFFSIHAGTLAPYLQAHTEVATQDQNLTVLASNFYYTNTQFEELFPVLQKENPDLFIIHEANADWETGLTLFQEDYPHQALTQKTGVHGIAMASRIPGSFKEIPLGTEVGLEFTPEDASYHILGVHPMAPLTAAWAAERNTQFQDLVAYTKASPVPILIMGDFNATPWSPHFIDLLKNASLQDARVGFGLIPTWHAHNLLFQLPIDHALLSSGWEVLDFHAADRLSADHLPIVVRLNHLKSTSISPFKERSSNTVSEASE
ncbi:MAG: endonuclease/exonuclease/phosphatase family protein [Candidatus Gracilibacteria bacterium]|jgi:endonuclease/exonuclease/phosphatase (EEP) superfamily protein YafD